MNERTEAIAASEANGVNDLTITIIYDNNPYKEALETAWGFSCLIRGTEKTILFDTGGDRSILVNNMEELAIDPNEIDTVVLSHIHGDHTGGLDGFLEKKANVAVCLPRSFPKRFKNELASCGSRIIEAEGPLRICKSVYSTGQLGTLIKEQSLIIRMGRGLVVITGCAHPGIVKIVRTAKGIVKDDVLLVIGGFHLEWATKGKLGKIVAAFRKLSVRYVGLCHCSGERARDLFERNFGRNYINTGAGKIVTAIDMQ